MLRKKICRILSAIMIATSVFGAITPVAKADVINASVLINKEQLQSGIYTVKNTTKYVEEGNATDEGMARKVLKEDSKIVVQNAKVILQDTLQIVSMGIPQQEELSKVKL